jgi:hypothetical protein
VQRTRTENIVFPIPFRIKGYERQIPAGQYSVEIVEEQIGGLSFSAYRRISTTLVIEGPETGFDGAVFLSVAQADLDNAQRFD